MLSHHRVDDIAARQLRQACAELERRLRAGLACCSEELLPEFPAVADSAEAAVELIYTEFVVRRQLGQAPSAAAWGVRFPQWREDLQEVFQVDRLIYDSNLRLAAADRSTPALAGAPSQALDPGAGRNGFPRQFGCYELLAEIGRGGMGVVYKARQTRLQRLVALKVILAGEHAGVLELDRFRAEAEAAARLQHPHIVQIFEIGTAGDQPFLVLEYVEGTTLADRLLSGPLPAAEAAALVEILARAVEHAHQRGVVHRDLKPANILLPGGGQAAVAKITDFGLAKQVRAEGAAPLRTQTGLLLGTPSYMAPEQAVGNSAAVGPRTDVYGLGAILYEVVTGRPPFRGATLLDTLEQVRSQDPVPPRQLQPTLSRDLDTICLQCLRKEPYQRYSSAQALAGDLGRYLAGEPILARPVGRGERLWKWARRRPAVAALAAALFGLAVAAFSVVTILWLMTADALQAAEIALAGEASQLKQANAARAAEFDERNKAEVSLFDVKVVLAYRLWENHKFEQAKQALLACDPAHKDAKWRYLDRVLHSRLWQKVSKGSPSALAFDPTGKRLAVCTQNGLQMFEGDSGQELLFRPGLVQQVAFDQERNRLIVFELPKWVDRKAPIPPWTVVVLDLQSGDKVGGFEVDSSISTCHLSPLGDLVGMLQRVKAKSKDQLLWQDPLDGHVMHTSGPTQPNPYLGLYSGNGQRFAVMYVNGEIVVWDTQSKGLVQTVSANPKAADDFNVSNRFCINWRGDLLAVPYQFRKGGDNTRGPIKVFDIASDKAIITLEPYALKSVGALAFCPSGQRLAAAAHDGTIVVLDLQTGKELLIFRDESATVRGLHFSPDGQRLAVADSKAVSVWDTRPLEK